MFALKKNIFLLIGGVLLLMLTAWVFITAKLSEQMMICPMGIRVKIVIAVMFICGTAMTGAYIVKTARLKNNNK